jgi:hypothetical protein
MSDVIPPTIYSQGRLYAPEEPEATALVVRNGQIDYVGSDEGARSFASGAPEIDLGGRLVTPAFVDSHVHTIQTGQVMNGLDLSTASDRADVLDAVARFARRHPDRKLIVGQGWDERYWPDPRPPLRAELDRAGGGAAVYLARVDVHSAIVSTALLDQIPGVADQPGFCPDGPVTRDAHHLCRSATDRLFTDAERRADARTALNRAAQVGIGCVHELGGPHLGPQEDLLRVQQVGSQVGVDIVCYWGELADDQSVVDAAIRVNARGLAGDLCVDGAIGSHTAALFEPYSDSDGLGNRYLDVDQISRHVSACTRAGLQAGFHCIGDDAVAATVDGFRRAAATVGEGRVRQAGHRLEHVEMIDTAGIRVLARLGVMASMQPAFDMAWGAPGELYEQRLGQRAASMNRLATLHRGGVGLAFGSDSPVTPLAGWETVRAATHHSNTVERLDVPTAFAAATFGAARAGQDHHLGMLTVGARANLSIWQPFADQRPDGLPTLEDELPVCAATVARGRAIYSDGSIDGFPFPASDDG